MRIFLVRHGESEGNIDENIYKHTADHDIALTDLGLEQARECGKFLNEYLDKNPAQPSLNFGGQVNPQLNQMVGQLFGTLMAMQKQSNQPQAPYSAQLRLWNSPYRRTRETASLIENAIKPHVRDTREDVLLCEQQWGLFDGLTKEEQQEQFPLESKYLRKQIDSNGKFWARFPQGESAFDVAIRLKHFFGTIKRDEEDKQIQDVVVVCHGNTLRLFTMMWLHKPYEFFETEPNPGNCAIRLIENNEDKGYIFDGHKNYKKDK